MTTEAVVPLRGGFWRRAIALALDAVVAAAVVVVVGLLASALTDGRVRISETHFFESDQCLDIDPVYEGVVLPEGFKPTSASRCVSSFLGYPYDWYLIVDEQTSSGGLTFSRSLSFPLDRSGKVVGALYLDWFLVFVLLLLVFVQEKIFATTLGKLLMGLRVQSLDGGLPSRAQIVRRLSRFCYGLPYLVTYAGLLVFTRMGASVSFLSSFMICGIALTILAVLHFAWAVRKGRLPFYDRWARTNVVRASKSAANDREAN